MKTQSAALWTLILVLSLGLITFLIVGMRQPAAATTLLTAAATQPALSLVVAPTRFLPTVAAVQSTRIPPVIPVAPVTLVAPTVPPRAFQFNQSMPGESMLTSFCPELGFPVSLRIFDWQTGNTISLNDPAVAQLPLSWDASDDLWRGYNALNPFDQPSDTQERWKITLFLPDSTERWISVYDSPTTPSLSYLYAYQNTTAFADANGNHFGFHPCRAFAYPAAQIEAFMTAIADYQDVVEYPSLISSHDSRWQWGFVTPAAAYTDLRAIPSVNYNVPIGGFNRKTRVFYATDPTWGQWAQIKMGAVQGWVDTRLVSFEPNASELPVDCDCSEENR